MRNTLLMWHDEASCMASMRRKAERLRAAADNALLAHAWHEWRCHVDRKRRSLELLQRREAELAVRCQCQVCGELAAVNVCK